MIMNEILRHKHIRISLIEKVKLYIANQIPLCFKKWTKRVKF